MDDGCCKIKRWMAAALALVLLSACGGGGAPSAQSDGVILGAAAEYLGTADCAIVSGSHCLRGPGAPGTFVTVDQLGNSGAFTITSADPTIGTGIVVQSYLNGTTRSAIEFPVMKAGRTVLTVTGRNGAIAKLALTVTTIATLTIVVNGIPQAATIHIAVSAPVNAVCPDFEGGYSFAIGPLVGGSVTVANFPAMGAGPNPACIFSTLTATAQDANGASLAQKTFSLPIALGQDNSMTLSMP